MRYNIIGKNIDVWDKTKEMVEKKLDRMVMRDLYGKFKTAPTEEEREKSRQEYLDRRGIPENFRW